MGGAVPAGDQHAAPGMETGPKRFHCHGLSPPRIWAKQKAGANNHAFLRQSLAPALKALALVDYDRDFLLAVSAVQRHPLRFIPWVDLVQLLVAAAARADEVSVSHCQHFTMNRLGFQGFFLSFP